MPDTSHNRAARRRETQRELRAFAARLAAVNPWHPDCFGSVHCAFCRTVDAADSPVAHREHRAGCLWTEVRDWLVRHRVDSDA